MTEEINEEYIKVKKNYIAYLLIGICIAAIVSSLIYLGIKVNDVIVDKTTSKVQNESMLLCQQQFINFQNSITQQLLTTGKITIKIGEQQINLVPER